jgi:hypothetical protein
VKSPASFAATRSTCGSGEADSALLYRKSNPFDEYGVRLSKFGESLGLSQYEGYALTWRLKLKDDPAAYFVRRTKEGNIQFQGLSARALDLARTAMASPGFDLHEIVVAYGRRNDKR